MRKNTNTVSKMPITNIRLDHSNLHKELQYLLEYGIVVIDKPSNLTSHQVADVVKQLLNLDKTGHSGTLDPIVTGVLPVALSRATRIMEYLLKSSKKYVSIMHLHKPVPIKEVEAVIREKFLGKIEQLPPIKSAVKRQLRTREIFDVKILEASDDEKDYLIEVECEAGTYIRKLIHDIGLALGIGANMQELRRIKSGMFVESDAMTLQQLEDAVVFSNKGDYSFLKKCIFPMSYCVKEIPHVELEKESVKKVINGMSFQHINHYKDEVALFFKGYFIGFGKPISAKFIRPHRIYFNMDSAKKYLDV